MFFKKTKKDYIDDIWDLFVSNLLKNNADINKKHKNDVTPIMYACALGNKDLVEFLLSKGAKIQQIQTSKRPDKTQRENPLDKTVNPLLIAAANGKKDIVSLLLQYASVDIDNLCVKPALKTSSQPLSEYEILKSSFYCQNPNQKKDVDELFSNISDMKDFRLSQIFKSAALNSLLDNGLKIFASSGDSLFPLTPTKGGTVAKGVYLSDQNSNVNVLQVSNLNDIPLCTKIICHEIIHFFRFNKDTSKNFNMNDKELESLVSIVRKIEHNIQEMPDSKAKTFLEDEYITKIQANKNLYPNMSQITEEAIANIGKSLVFIHENPSEKKLVLSALSPLLDYFDKKILPEMQRYIENHPKRSLLLLPQNKLERSNSNQNLTLD